MKISYFKLAIFLIFAALVVAMIFWAFRSEDRTKITIGEKEVVVEIADTKDEREQGFSGRESLDENEGLLMIFAEPDFYSFHMKEMNFSIDMIWISEGKEVVDMVKEVSPDSYPQVFRTKVAAKYALEVPGGFVDENKIKIGDKFSF